MTDNWLLFFLVLLTGILAGLYLAGQKKSKKTRQKLEKLNHRYFQGLNYLLNDESDKAIDVFIKLAETSHETFEPQLALGNLYRRKGEVDRAIRLHQSLISQAKLPENYRTRALLAIGKDYMSAGLLDRAEVLFSELVEIEAHTPEALKSLNDIYQQEQDWLEAIRSATRYEAVSGRSMIINVSHYYCELADQAVLQNDSKSAEKYLASALRVDDKAVRAYLCRAKIQVGNKKWQKAIDNYHHAIKADSSYIPVFIDDMAQCYMELSQTKELESFLLHLIGKYQGVSPILTLSNLYSSTQGVEFAAAFVEQQLKQRASVKGLNALIELKLSMLDSDEQEKSYFHVLKTLVDQLLLDKPRLRCRKCGFGAKAIHWQCPSCKNWGVVKPIYGLESE